MVTIGWRFPPLSGGNRQAYTRQDIDCFKGEELMDNLAREICQNSLDARSPHAVGPVKVVFEQKQVDTKDYPLFSQYGKCLKGCREYWREDADQKLNAFLDGAEQTLSSGKVSLLIASDYNTKGLSGSKKHIPKSTWDALTSSEGLSVKSSDTSGGSYGVGKNAPFACSSLSMVFYNTFCEEDHDKAFVGVARVATLLNEKGKPTQGTGKFQKNDDENEVWLPIYEDDSNGFRDLFSRNEYGSDVIIVGFNQTENWQEQIKTAVIKNFFIGILEQKLVVEIRNGNTVESISAATISREISELPSTRDLKAIGQLYKAFTSPDKQQSISILEDDDVEVYVKADSSYSQIIAELRDTGMLVRIKTKRFIQCYAALVIVRGDEISSLLKDTEPARHNKWDYKIIPENESERRKRARKAIKKIDDSVFDIIQSMFSSAKSDSMDAVGLSQYLPDDNPAALGEAVTGDDALKVKIKISKTRIDKPEPEKAFYSGHPSSGTPIKGDTHNTQTRPDPPDEPTERPEVVDPKPEPKPNEPKRRGVSVGHGTKIIRIPNLTAQRAYPINSSLGLYKIMIKPTQDYDNIYVECLATGEDGTADGLSVESFTYNGSPINVVDGKAGPLSIEADKPAFFYARFENREKMLLKINVTEEVDVK